MATTMLPAVEALPDVLPTDSLTRTAVPVPPLRAELRRIGNTRNALHVAGAYAQSFGVIALAAAVHHPLGWLAAFVLVGRAFGLYGILMHEAAHRLLFSNRKANDWVGRWLLGYPAFTPIDLYRRSHMAHHKEPFGPNEPDLNLYNGYPITRASFGRKMRRDLFFESGWKTVKALARGLKSGFVEARRIVAVQAVILAGFTLAGRPELYLFLWLLPWMSVWRVINRLRGIAEHGGMTRSDDSRLTTHHVRQTPWARFWLVPYNTGWHLAHHVDSGIPFRNLPKLHAELEAAGWVTPALEYTSYTALWRKLASRPAAG